MSPERTVVSPDCLGPSPFLGYQILAHLFIVRVGQVFWFQGLCESDRPSLSSAVYSLGEAIFKAMLGQP